MNNYQTRFIKNSKIEQINHFGKQHIAVVGGGMSAEREVSLSSTKAVLDAVVQLGYQTTFIDMGADIATILQELKPDIVYNSLHGTYGEDGCLPGLLNIMRLPYTHSGVLASSLAFCKLKSKNFFEINNIKTASHIIVNKSDNLKEIPFQGSYVIKPLLQGSSIGIEVIFPEDNYDFSNYNYPYGDKIMVEKYIKGREMQVAVLNGESLGILEIKLLKNRFYDYETKYNAGLAEHIFPAQISKKIENKLLTTSEKAFNILGCNGLVRSEFIYNEQEEEIYIIEVNTHSGMTPLSICPEIAQGKNINFQQLIEKIIESAKFEI